MHLTCVLVYTLHHKPRAIARKDSPISSILLAEIISFLLRDRSSLHHSGVLLTLHNVLKTSHRPNSPDLIQPIKLQLMWVHVTTVGSMVILLISVRRRYKAGFLFPIKLVGTEEESARQHVRIS